MLYSGIYSAAAEAKTQPHTRLMARDASNVEAPKPVLCLHLHCEPVAEFVCLNSLMVNQMAKEKYYAVSNGREGTQIYQTWDEVRRCSYSSNRQIFTRRLTLYQTKANVSRQVRTFNVLLFTRGFPGLASILREVQELSFVG